MKKIRVLIVEDEPIIAADLTDRLLDMGYEIAGQYARGEEAIQWFDPATVDLVLMDVQLEGDLDGIQTAHRLLEKHTLPIIYLTGNGDDATFSRAKSTQPAAFLSKPFRGKDLKHAIELAISRPTGMPTTTAEDGSTFLFKDRLFVKSKDRLIRIFLTDILWIEADDYYCKLVTHEKEILIGQTLKHIGETLADLPQFMRVHRSFLANLAHVEEIGDQFISINKKQIPLNKSAKDELNARLQRI